MDLSKKKILIVSVSAGAGHVQVAKAIEQTAKQLDPNAKIKHIDMMEYVSAPIKTAIVDVYDVLIRTAPSLWGYFYSKSDSPKIVDRLGSMIKAVNNLNAKKFFKLLEEYQPDHVLCTHSFPAQVMRNCKDESIKHLPISLILTDYGFHSYWVMPDIQNYFVATEKMQWELKRCLDEKDSANIVVSGIPVRPIFYEKKDEQKLKKKYGIREASRCVLVLAGGQGLMESDELVDQIADERLENPLDIIAIAGKNRKLFKTLEKQSKTLPESVHLHTVGWTEHMDEYMRISDIIVSKPGGSTTSECLALNKKLVSVRPIPGQEEKNAQYLLETGKGYIAHSKEDLLYYLQKGTVIHSIKKNSVTNPAKRILNIIFNKKNL